MERNDPKKAFSRLGFAQIAGIAASIILSEAILTPLATDVNMQKITDIAGPSALLFMVYLPQIVFLLLF